jgi:hypothetical protein
VCRKEECYKRGADEGLKTMFSDVIGVIGKVRKGKVPKGPPSFTPEGASRAGELPLKRLMEKHSFGVRFEAPTHYWLYIKKFNCELLR